MNGNAVTKTLYGGEVTLTFDPGPHSYTWQERTSKFPGPTTALAVCIDKSQVLKPWACKMMYQRILDQAQKYLQCDELGINKLQCTEDEFLDLIKDGMSAHKKVSDRALDVGTMAHDYAEHWITHGWANMPSDPKAAKGCTAFLAWIQDPNIKALEPEALVLSRKYEYAGKMDLLAEIRGELCVVDFKASTGHYVPDYPYQLAAYAVAKEEEIQRPIDVGWIVRLDKETGRCDPRRYSLTPAVKQGWLDLLTDYRSQKATEKFYHGRK